MLEKHISVNLEKEDLHLEHALDLIFPDFEYTFVPYYANEEYTIDQNSLTRSDDPHVRLFPRSVYPSSKTILQPQDMRNVVKHIATYSGYKITSLSSVNYGEEVVIKGVSDVISNRTPGIGDSQPNIYMSMSPIGSFTAIATLYQLVCENMALAVASDGTASVFQYSVKTLLELESKVYTSIKDTLPNFAITLDMLEKWRAVPLSTVQLEELYSEYRNCASVSEEKPTIWRNFLAAYDSAPNSAPNTLLGFYNGVTNELAKNKATSQLRGGIKGIKNNPLFSKTKYAFSIAKNYYDRN
jgi:hypothetical protein